jgi:hypothetical protein
VGALRRGAGTHETVTRATVPRSQRDHKRLRIAPDGASPRPSGPLRFARSPGLLRTGWTRPDRACGSSSPAPGTAFCQFRGYSSVRAGPESHK